MNIIIIGTSNSVMGRNGFIKSLSRVHNVTNLSIGRAPFYLHISTILRNKELIESSDVLIIDHLSNPGFLGSPNYRSHLVNFYDLLSSLNTNVIVLSLPYKNMNAKFSQHRALAEKLSSERSITFINFKNSYISDDWFSDPRHIKMIPSYILGEWLAEECAKIISSKKPDSGFFYGYRFVEPENKDGFFKNSLVSRGFRTIDSKGSLSIPARGELLSVEFFTAGDSIHRFNLNGRLYHISDTKGVFHDVFQEVVNIDGALTIKHHEGKDTKPVQKHRKENVEESPLKLIGFLIAENDFRFARAINRIEFEFDMLKLKNKLDDYFILTSNVSSGLSKEEVNLIRDSAVLVEKRDLNKAYLLMRLALKYRPSGTFLKDKIEYYKNRMRAVSDN